jgi:hypothetical protein
MKDGMEGPYKTGVAIRSASSYALLPEGPSEQRNIQPGFRRSKTALKATSRGALGRIPVRSGVVEDPRHA